MWSKSVPFCFLAGSGRGKHSVGKHGVRESFIPQHPVICREAAGEGRVETGPHPVLELSKTSTYVRYPYLESHESREPVPS